MSDSPTKSVLPGTLASLAAAAILALPFIQSDSTIDIDLLPKFMGMALLTLCLQANFAFRRERNIVSFRYINPVAWTFVGFGALSLAFIGQASNFAEAAFEAIKTTLLASLLFNTAKLMSESGAGRTREVLTKFMIFFAGTSSGLGLIEAASRLSDGYTLNALYKVTGAFAHKNLFCSILFLSLPFCAFGIRRYYGFWRAAGAFSLVSGLSLIIILQTRSVWFALAASTVSGAMLILATPGKFRTTLEVRLRSRFLKGFLCTAIGVFLLSGALVFLGPKPTPSGFLERVASSFDPAKNQWRLLIWSKSLDMAAEQPWTGVGPGNWKIEFPKYGTKDIRIVGGERSGEEAGFARPHNDFIWVLCETGIFGALLYTGFFLGLLAVCIRNRIRETDPDARLFAVCQFAAVTGYMVDASFSFPRERIAHSIFLMLIAASILARPISNPLVSARRPVFRRTIRIAGLAMPLMALAFGWFRLKSEMHVRIALEARADGRWQDVISEISKADRRIYPMDPIPNPIMFYRGTAYFLAGEPNHALADFRKAILDHPFHAHSLNNLGACMELAGHPEKAVDFILRAVDLRPDLDEGWLNLAAIYYNLGDYRESWKYFSKSPPQPQHPTWKRLSELLPNVEGSRK